MCRWGGWLMMLLKFFSYKMNILMAGREVIFNVSGILLTIEDGYDSESTSRQRYLECYAALKVFSNHLLKIALYG
jgi:hypothetical protein